ncbi:MAG TPA: 16S rRNA (guanine(966)-N(2))-methyltransferase RsmD [Terriglobales bacterium]|nr:16S rRNA (guanine(966)-N(2))-methyltransferase RsmD [Terriglobales bacterium]
MQHSSASAANCDQKVRMRVIAGKFRSRPLRSLQGMDIRPTSDRLRETLFNVLSAGNPAALEGSVWLDLFAGTGAVGIEALSRGATMVYFVEKSKTAVELIAKNLEPFGVGDEFEILRQDVRRAISTLELRQLKPDFIFLDPPYAMDEAYTETLGALAGSAISEKALVVAEHDKKFDAGEEFGLLHRTRRLEQGDAVLSFYRRAL